MKITIIMPTYNDAESIEEALESVISQSYNNWELLVSDDGSTDNTKMIVNDFIKRHKEKRIRYFYQQNQDQLNAILNVTEEIKGDYIFVLHSDDLLADNDILEKAVLYLEKNDVDAIISNPIVINKAGEVVGVQKVKKYKKKDYILALQLLWLGRNCYIDVAFHSRKSFFDNITKGYLTWNCPFWIKIDDHVSMLNVENVSFPFFKYRVFEGNYINNEIGKLNVINGELRTAINLMKFYDIPFYKFQYFLFRIFNKLKMNYIPFYFRRETRNKGKIVDFIIKKRFEKTTNLFLNNLSNFYNKVNTRSIYIDDIGENEFLYYGKDMRKFNNDLLNDKLSNIYKKIIEEMANGFNTIIVKNEEDKKKIIIIKFLCIYPFVNVEIA